MTFDGGTIVVLGLVLAFIGFIVWAELDSRRQLRRNGEERPASVAGVTSKKRYSS